MCDWRLQASLSGLWLCLVGSFVTLISTLTVLHFEYSIVRLDAKPPDDGGVQHSNCVEGASIEMHHAGDDSRTLQLDVSPL